MRRTPWAAIGFVGSFLIMMLVAGCPSPAEGEGEGEGEGEAEEEDLVEAEPNDGASDTQMNGLPPQRTMRGAIDVEGDRDLFLVATTTGRAYRAGVDVPEGSLLDASLTILDSGRDGEPAGQDYVRIGTAPEGATVSLEFFAFGAGHIIAVQDQNGAGGASYGYSLRIEAVDVEPPALLFPSSINDVLPTIGSVRSYAFFGNEGSDFTVDLQAAGDLDARLFVYAAGTGSWVARNDDRIFNTDVNPLLDAFFPVGGAMLLVVEATTEDATDLGYALTTTGNAP